MPELRLDLSTAVQIVVPIVAAALAYGAVSARLDGVRESVRSLERALELERSERLAYQMMQQQERIAWVLRRPAARLDPALAAGAKAAAGEP